ncbi:MAG: hypothetical protein ACN6PB_14865, partial [Achromobacter kerstersii]|uniref:hypothetical protein n=1 Tax=Achromobacter kerstersii TaxID=1353890 RepID=UPI003D02D9F2
MPQAPALAQLPQALALVQDALQKLPGSFFARCVDDGFGGPHFAQGALIKEGHPISAFAGEGNIVSDDD